MASNAGFEVDKMEFGLRRTVVDTEQGSAATDRVVDLVNERGESKPGSLRQPSAMGPTLNTAAVAPVVDPKCQSSTGYEAHRREGVSERIDVCVAILLLWPGGGPPRRRRRPSSSRRGGIATVVDFVTPKCHNSVDPPSDRSIIRVSILSLRLAPRLKDKPLAAAACFESRVAADMPRTACFEPRGAADMPRTACFEPRGAAYMPRTACFDGIFAAKTSPALGQQQSRQSSCFHLPCYTD
ncbi:hypothetical protein THAOC_28610 [Thalassiosira oceanica]|uniref:Uncharacterized protein n=1 Tax=Thalassiosira oceanica TaxID=159749 RepID=K0RZY5_THAOC|nr:hypothetical protein THAOC_28610 [Thalassiosira oceanica]|eukprot:EJK52152.1 hypothetical protein THAOC_28610 [Thalassiosira oceanica]